MTCGPHQKISKERWIITNHHAMFMPFLGRETIHILPIVFQSIWMWVNTYRYIFSGMNIHKSQLFWGSLGTRVLTHPHIILSIHIPLAIRLRAFHESWWRVGPQLMTLDE